MANIAKVKDEDALHLSEDEALRYKFYKEYLANGKNATEAYITVNRLKDVTDRAERKKVSNNAGRWLHGKTLKTAMAKVGKYKEQDHTLFKPYYTSLVDEELVERLSNKDLSNKDFSKLAEIYYKRNGSYITDNLGKDTSTVRLVLKGGDFETEDASGNIRDSNGNILDPGESTTEYIEPLDTEESPEGHFSVKGESEGSGGKG